MRQGVIVIVKHKPPLVLTEKTVEKLSHSLNDFIVGGLFYELGHVSALE
jgi:hypothetical protein